ncbi:hypothetical protein D3C83_153550 [compost metagenome]
MQANKRLKNMFSFTGIETDTIISYFDLLKNLAGRQAGSCYFFFAGPNTADLYTQGNGIPAEFK